MQFPEKYNERLRVSHRDWVDIGNQLNSMRLISWGSTTIIILATILFIFSIMKLAEQGLLNGGILLLSISAIVLSGGGIGVSYPGNRLGVAAMKLSFLLSGFTENVEALRRERMILQKQVDKFQSEQQAFRETTKRCDNYAEKLLKQTKRYYEMDRKIEREKQNGNKRS